MASGYFHVEDHLQPAPSYYCAGGGDLYSALDDLERWSNAIADGTLISKESYKKMFTPVEVKNVKLPEFLQNYSCGMGI